MSSSLAAGVTTQLSNYFHVTDKEYLVLPTSIFLVGYTFGPLIFGPLSESFGRKWTMIVAFFAFTLFSMASTLAPNWPVLIVFRLFVGITGACPIAVVGGICSDIYHNPQSRGRALTTFTAATTYGPVLGPPISGFISVITWRWAFWIGVVVAGIAWSFLIMMPETCSPVLLKHRAAKLRKETGNSSIFAPIELEKTNIGHIITVVLTRPIRMFCFEPLVLCMCIYLGFAYGVRHILSLLRVIPHHLHRHIRLQRWRRRPRIHPHRCRRPHIRRQHHGSGKHVPQHIRCRPAFCRPFHV